MGGGNSQRAAEILVTDVAMDDEETSFTVDEVGDEEKQRSSAPTDPTDHSLFDSVANIRPVTSNDNHLKHMSAGSDTDDCVPNGESFFHASKSSYNSLDTGNDSGNGTTDTDYSGGGSLAREQRIFKSLIFGLLALAGILGGMLAVLSSRNHYVTACSFASLFVIGAIGFVFKLYDTRVKKREALLIRSVTRSEAIVDSLFPEIVRDRILEEGNWAAAAAAVSPSARSGTTPPEPTANAGKKHFPSDPTKEDIQILRNATSSEERDKSTSNSGRNLDDPILKNLKEKPLLTPPASPPKASFFSSPKRTKSNISNASTSTTGVSDVCGSGDSIPDRSYHHKSTSSLVTGSAHSIPPSSSKPIADYFPSATILFADIVGFTSWASIREPAQVFELLETVYGRFDDIAKKKGVFKVETIGDCYVAATGLPKAMDDHAVTMASFARRCLETMLDTVADLEESLGPGTADLGMRMGIHSGSVIGGVLRGAKTRYQLFGDTINTASRIESTSQKNKIHLSEQTAELIVAAGKKPWVEPRGETIFAKGKGELKTYWLTIEGPKNLSAQEQLALPALLKMMAKANIDPGFIKKKKAIEPSEKRERLVDYHTNVLKRLLKKLVAMRHSKDNDCSIIGSHIIKVDGSLILGENALASKTFTEETMEGILFPAPTKEAAITDNLAGETSPHVIDALVLGQLRELVWRVSRLYRDHRPFHTFEHASHTVLSITKLMTAIEATGSTTDRVLNITKSMITHPLTQFVLVFAALVNDAGSEDARGTRLVAAEKSFCHAWSLFSDPAFKDLRGCICKSPRDFEFFRRLLGKSILALTAEATDDIQDCGGRAWAKLPVLRGTSSSVKNHEANQKTMAIIEKLLRVSDVSHALQHFPVFKKWNRLLFEEAYGTFGSENNTNQKEDPSKSWYEKELQLFDGRIRLAKGLRDSGVFNKTADVYLAAAIANRREWEQKGRSIIAGYRSTT